MKISLLRGINVSGQKKIIMKDLKALYESLGFENVVTYIQSGNIIFKSNQSEDALISLIEKAIANKYGFDVPVQVRDTKALNSIINALPFSELDLVSEGTRVMLTFLASLPTAEHIENLNELSLS